MAPYQGSYTLTSLESNQLQLWNFITVVGRNADLNAAMDAAPIPSGVANYAITRYSFDASIESGGGASYSIVFGLQRQFYPQFYGSWVFFTDESAGEGFKVWANGDEVKQHVRDRDAYWRIH